MDYMNTILYISSFILLPIIMGFLLLFIPEKINKIRQLLVFFTTGGVFAVSLILFITKDYLLVNFQFFISGPVEISFQFCTTPFNVICLLFLSFSGVCIALYSMADNSGKYDREYTTFFLLAIGAGCGALLSNNLIIFFVFSEIVSVSLYFLLSSGSTDSKESGDSREPGYRSTKTMIMIGFSDACLFFGIVLLWYLEKTFTVTEINIYSGDWITDCAIFLIITGVCGKAGAVPFHTWVPSAGRKGAAAVMAIIPGTIHSLLGVYLLLSVSIKLISVSFSFQLTLLIIGALSIVVGGVMSIIQKNLLQLLSCSIISQNGYIILGIGTMQPAGIAGALFHMMNHSMCITILLLSSDIVETKTHTGNLANLGGLARVLPGIFISFIISALSLSGIPPFSGFVSRWFIYQGIINSSAGLFSSVFLFTAMIGGSFVLAAYLKAVSSVFLGRKSGKTGQVKKGASITRLLPVLISAFLCVLFGVIYDIPVKFFIRPIMLNLKIPLSIEKGVFNAPLIAVFIMIGLIIGLLIYITGSMRRRSKKVNAFTGGEEVKSGILRLPGASVYNSITHMLFIKSLYSTQKKVIFDPYTLLGKIGQDISSLLKRIYSGYAAFYISWLSVELIILFILIAFS